MKRYLKNLFLTFLVMAFIWGNHSCKKEEDPVNPQDQTEEPTNEEFPAPNVMDAETREAIKELDTTNFTFTFNAETEITQNLEVGSILVDSSSSLAPYGYLRKVTAINSSKGETTVSTEQARLVDIADTGSIRFRTGKIPQSKVQKIVLSEGVQWVGQKDPNFSVYEFDYKKTYTGDYGEFTVEGHTSLDMDFFFDFDWHWEWDLWPVLGHPQADLFESGVEINQLASIQTEATGAYHLPGEKISLAEFYFSPWTFMVGFVPVVFLPKIELFILPSGQIVAEFTAGASEEFNGRVGTRYTHSNGWGEISEGDYETDFSAPNMNVAINYKVNVGPEVSLMLYGITGPRASISAYAELDSEQGTSAGNWYLDFIVGIESEVGVAIDIIFYEDSWSTSFQLFQDTLIHYDNEPFGNVIYIDAPVGGSEFAIGDNINFQCSYTGDTPDEVNFYIGSDLIFSDTEAPYEYSWETQDLNEGEYTLSVEEVMDGITISTDETNFYLRKIEWTEIDLSSLGINESTYLTDIAITGENKAMITTFEGTSGKILKTANDGDSWSVELETNYGLMQLQPLNTTNEVAFLTAYNKVNFTDDGGATITELQYDFYGNPRPTFQWKNIFGLGMNEEGEILAVGKDTGIPYQFEVYRADGESHEPFEDFSLPHPNEYGYSPQLFANGDQVLVYGIQDEDNSNALFYEISLDGGENWADHQFVGLTDADMLKGASMFNDDDWWIVGETSGGEAIVLISENGGMSWEKVVLDEISGFASVTFVDASKGYATVNKTTTEPEPKIYQTTDGGYTWEPVFGINTTQGMKKVVFQGNQKGFAIGQGASIYKYGI